MGNVASLGARVPFGGEIAEKFSAGIDQTIGVTVPYQEGIVFAHPTGSRQNAVAVVIKINAGRETHCFQTIAVKVEHYGAAWPGSSF